MATCLGIGAERGANHVATAAPPRRFARYASCRRRHQTHAPASLHWAALRLNMPASSLSPLLWARTPAAAPSRVGRRPVRALALPRHQQSALHDAGLRSAMLGALVAPLLLVSGGRRGGSGTGAACIAGCLSRRTPCSSCSCSAIHPGSLLLSTLAGTSGAGRSRAIWCGDAGGRLPAGGGGGSSDGSRPALCCCSRHAERACPGGGCRCRTQGGLAGMRGGTAPLRQPSTLASGTAGAQFMCALPHHRLTGSWCGWAACSCRRAAGRPGKRPQRGPPPSRWAVMWRCTACPARS